MVKRSRGDLSSYTRRLKSKGKLGLTKLLKSFEVGDKVIVNQKPGHPGMPHPRYRGRHGVIVGKQGSAYRVQIKDGKSEKVLISKPVHLDKI